MVSGGPRVVRTDSAERSGGSPASGGGLGGDTEALPVTTSVGGAAGTGSSATAESTVESGAVVGAEARRRPVWSLRHEGALITLARSLARPPARSSVLLCAQSSARLSPPGRSPSGRPPAGPGQ